MSNKSALFGPAMICTNLPHVKGTIPGATECHRNKFQFGYIYSWWLTPMLGSRVALPPKSTLVAGLQVFRNQRSSTSAISDSDSSSSTPWGGLFWGLLVLKLANKNPKTPLLRHLKQLRHLDSYELAQVAKQDPVAKVRTLKTVWAILIYIGGCLLYIINRLLQCTWNEHLKANRNIWKVKSKWFNPSVSRRRRFPDSEFSNKSPVFWLGPRTNGRASTCIYMWEECLDPKIDKKNQVYTSKIWSKEWNKQFNISDDL